MKKSLFLSTLIAATALAVPAFASGTGTDTDPYTGTENDFNPDGSTSTSGVVYIQNITGGYWAPGSNDALTITSNLYITYTAGDEYKNGITLNNGYSGTIYTFTGTISGDGNWTFSSGSGTTPTQHYIFTGDLSGYSGNFSMTAGSSSNSEGYLQFGNGGQAATNTAVSGTGSITESTSGSGFAVIYNYGSLASGSENAITISNSSITTGDLQFNGSVNYDVSSALVGNGSNAKLTIANAGYTTTFNKSVSGFSTIVSRSTISVGDTGSFDISGSSVTLDSAIQNSGEIIISESTTFVLDGLTATSGSLSGGSATYTLITGTGTIKLGDTELTGGTLSLGTSNVSSSDYTITGATFTVDSGTLSVTVTTDTTGGLLNGLHGTGSSSSQYYTTGSSGDTIIISTSIFTGAGTTVYLASDSYSLGSESMQIYWSGAFTAACDVVIGKAGIYITDGSGGQSHVFTGAISGEGSITVSSNSKNTGSGSVNQDYTFTGDLSEWSGNFTINTTSTSDYVYFGTGGTAATNTAVSGTGAIAVDYGTVRYNYSGYADDNATALTVENTSIEGHTVTFMGSVNYDVSSNLIGVDAGSATNSTLTISTTGTVTLSGEVSGFDRIVVSEGSGLTVATGASVTLKSSSTLTVESGATLTLNTSIAATGGTVYFADSASLVLTDAFLASTIAPLDADGTVTIIAASAIYYNSTVLSELNSGDISEFVSNVISWSDNYELSDWSYDNGVLSASVTYLPEPSMFGFFFGLGAIGLVATRRRRRA